MVHQGSIFVGDLKSTDEATAIFNASAAAGNTSALLTQAVDNIFGMSVANIKPKDTVRMDLFYALSMVPTNDIFEFYVPVMAQPRYAAGA